MRPGTGRRPPGAARGANGRFGRDRRLTRRAEFQKVYDQGTRLTGRLMTVFVLPNGGEVTRLGVAATRKLGGAVVRNRAKRRIRELFRRLPMDPGLDMVVVARRELAGAPFSSLESEFSSLLRRYRPPRR